MLTRFTTVLGLAMAPALISGCSGDALSPSISPAAAINPAVLSKLRPWGDLMSRQRRILAGLIATSQHAIPERVRLRNDSAIANVQRILERLRQDSVATAEHLKLVYNTSTLKPSFTWAGQSSSGAFVDEFTSTQFNLLSGYFPEFDVSDAVSVPALWIKARTTGQFVKQGQTYPILSDRSEGVLDERVIMSWFTSPDPEVPELWPGLVDVVPITVDCEHVGTEASATTTHTAGWFPVATGYTENSAITSGTDDGICPHVAPVAHFTYSSGDFSSHDPTVLRLTEASLDATIDLSALGTERDAPIASYDWYVNGQPIASGFYASYHMTTSNVGIQLDVTDALGMTSYADGGIVIQVASTGGGADDGGGTVCYEVWAIWPDGSEDYLGDVCFQYAQ